jgi:DNA-binding response OmpR family regulator
VGGPALPVIVLTLDPAEWAVLRALGSGADGCLRRKPLGYLELRGRVEAVLRRTQRPLRGAPRRVGQLTIDPPC